MVFWVMTPHSLVSVEKHFCWSESSCRSGWLYNTQQT